MVASCHDRTPTLWERARSEEPLHVGTLLPKRKSIASGCNLHLTYLAEYQLLGKFICFILSHFGTEKKIIFNKLAFQLLGGYIAPSMETEKN